MKICLFTSGYLRTLYHGFHKNADIIRSKIPNCKLDICYSFWNVNHRSDAINDPWHYKVDAAFESVDKKEIEQYFLDIGFSNVKGEIEPFSFSEEIMNNNNLPESRKVLSSQYWKIYNVAEKFFSDEYDFYLTIRPDAIINNFLDEERIFNLNLNKSIVVNERYWYDTHYDGINCNEYVWGSTKDTFINSNNQFLYLNSLVDEVHTMCSLCYGEIITGTHFKNMKNAQKISTIETFNFDYRIAR